MRRRAAAGLAAVVVGTTSLGGCGGAQTEHRGERPTPTPAVTPTLARLDLAALVEDVPGYTFAADPDTEELFVGRLGADAPENYLVRSIAVDGEPAGTVIVTDVGSPASRRDVRNFLAGAEDGARGTGVTSRTTVAGLPAVVTVRPDGFTTWSVPYERGYVIVGASEEVADDVMARLLQRLGA